MAKDSKKVSASHTVVEEAKKGPSKIVHERQEDGTLKLAAVPLTAEEIEKGSYVGFGSKGARPLKKLS